MRIICLVPSLTETLIEAGLNVVGRTRFCIHPADRVKSIRVVGGTKDLDWNIVHSLHPDLLILDQEENLEWMKSGAGCEVLVSRINSIQDMNEWAKHLSERFGENIWLKEFSKRWDAILTVPPANWCWQDIPGACETWLQAPETIQKIRYVIWRHPWMSVGRQTFISSVFERLGAQDFFLGSELAAKYPIFFESDFKDQNTVFLFSSEPFPFARFIPQLKAASPNGALVDGEGYSWFGLRALHFLESRLLI